jgi:hypothetical protein
MNPTEQTAQPFTAGQAAYDWQYRQWLSRYHALQNHLAREAVKADLATTQPGQAGQGE